MNAVQTKVLLATLATLAAMGGFAATWYVDAVNGNDTNGGTSVTDARRTLRGAMSISELKDDDTVLALPGVYGDESVVDASGVQTRCRISMAITLKSVGGRATRDVTVIRGARDAETGGLGDNAVRCVSIEAVGATLEGFTLTDGATKAGSDDAADNRGGGLLVFPKRTGYAVDCLFSNCVARAGGGMALGVGNNAEAAKRAVGAAVRCRFIGCSASSVGAAVREVPSWFCVFDGFDMTPVYSYTAPSVNCTFFVGCDDFAGAQGPSFNCVAISAKTNYKSYMTNCVVSAGLSKIYASACIREDYYKTLMAPCADDFRPLVESAAVGAGLFAWLEERVPEGYRQIDFDGNPVTAKDGSVTCGAIVVPAEPVGGYVTTAHATGTSGCTDFAVNGRPIPASFKLSRFYADTPNATFRLVPFVSGGSVYAVTNATEVFWPSRDGTVEVAVPESGVRRLAVAAASEELFVGDGENDYKTIQAAVNAANDRAVIRVRPGVYKTGGDEVGCASRVAIPAGKGIRLVSTDGADVTVVDGAGAARALPANRRIPCRSMASRSRMARRRTTPHTKMTKTRTRAAASTASTPIPSSRTASSRTVSRRAAAVCSTAPTGGAGSSTAVRITSAAQVRGKKIRERTVRVSRCTTRTSTAAGAASASSTSGIPSSAARSGRTTGAWIRICWGSSSDPGAEPSATRCSSALRSRTRKRPRRIRSR